MIAILSATLPLIWPSNIFLVRVFVTNNDCRCVDLDATPVLGSLVMVSSASEATFSMSFSLAVLGASRSALWASSLSMCLAQRSGCSLSGIEAPFEYDLHTL